MEKISKEKWIIDTDPGCDDMICLFYMLNRKDIEIEMISLIEGNTNIGNVCKNIKKILKIANRKELKVYKGCSPIMKGSPTASFVHMVDGLGDVDDLIKLNIDDISIEEENAAVKIVETILKYPYKINILAIGPLTNLAIAFMLNPEIVNLIKSIYIMGGTIKSTGNMLPCSEFNFSYDYIAPKIILNCFKNVIVVPWDTTEQHTITTDDIEKIKKDNLSYLYVHKLVSKMTNVHGGMKVNDFYCAICIFNKSVIKNCYLANCETILDTEIMRGSIAVKSRKKNVSFIDGLNEMRRSNTSGLQLIIDKLENEIVLNELCSIFS
jgi:purine nucleosidase